jgi:hypothetical protein
VNARTSNGKRYASKSRKINRSYRLRARNHALTHTFTGKEGYEQSSREINSIVAETQLVTSEKHSLVGNGDRLLRFRRIKGGWMRWDDNGARRIPGLGTSLWGIRNERPAARDYGPTATLVAGRLGL